MAKRKAPHNRKQTGLDVESKLPEWAGRELIACGNGPLSGMWFFREDWEARCRAQQRMRDLGQHASRGALDYQLTAKEVESPTYPGVMGIFAVQAQDSNVYA